MTDIDKLDARSQGSYSGHAKALDDAGICVFCDLRDKYVVTTDTEGEGKDAVEWVLTMNTHPRSRASMLTIPRRHIESVLELTSQDVVVKNRLDILAGRLLQEAFDIKDVNYILREGSVESSGKSVRHLHGHVMSYYHGLLMWWDERELKGRSLKSPDEVGLPLIDPVEAAVKFRDTLAQMKGESNGRS